MKVVRRVLSIASQEHNQMLNITQEVTKLIPTDFTGICNLFSLHTTAALTINENTDLNVTHDLQNDLSRLTPWNNPAYRHEEGNSAAHWRSSCFGNSLTIQIEKGVWLHGSWQGIYFCEFDGPRPRQISLMFIGESN